ncbi:SMI1/KNR4 family protein [Streptomyces sp. NPDC051636]|uniref:SMI1/KNR4 family protein n=1 Tax=Streptomyces sp. NPDC051636 TaxID=3365663 RepID=UPI0037BA620B
MSIPAVEDSWARIEAWLARHAPASHARLRPPASVSDIEAAERTLGVGFHPDLKESLRCHDGVDLQQGAPTLAYYGPPSSVADIVDSTRFLRGIGADVEPDDVLDEDDEDYDELATYWHHDWLLITLGIGWQSSDGLFLSCRPGPNWGRPGRYFDEDIPSFTAWPSLRHVLADYADALENGTTFDGRTPLAVDGVLLWDDEKTTVPDPASPLALAAAAGEPEPEPPAPAEPDPVPGRKAEGQRLLMVRVRRSSPPAPPPMQPDVVFVAGITPEELLRRLGAIPETLRPRGRQRARESAIAPWAAYRPMVRAGTLGGWAYATQEGAYGTQDGVAAQLLRPEVLRRASAGTRAVALTKRGPEVSVTLTEDGVPNPEQARRVESPRENHIPVVGPAQTVLGLGADPWPGSSAAYTRLLAGLERDFGIVYRPDDDVAAELTSALLLPVLDDIDEDAHQYVTEVRDFDLAGLVERTPPQRLRRAIAAQLTRLAAETRIDGYGEVADAVARTGRGEPVDLTPDGPLDLRMRTVAAEAWAARQLLRGPGRWSEGPVTQEDFGAWVIRAEALRALREFVRLPVRAAAATILHQRMSVFWRTELAADLRTP